MFGTQDEEFNISLDRRRLVSLAGFAALGMLPRFSIAEEYQKYLRRDWTVPAGTRQEIWPSRIGMDLAGTLAAIADWTVPSNSRLVIRLDDGEHFQKGRIVVQHAAGDRLSIIGNTQFPDRCRLVWASPEDALYVGAGELLAWIDGFTFEHSAPQTRGLGSAFLADEGGVIRCGPNVVVKNFYYGFQARRNGVIRCANTQCYGGGDANYFAFLGGHIYAPKARAVAARDDKKKLGSGFVAEYGGSIDAEGAIAELNALAGFTALSNGVIRAYNSQARRNGKAGYYSSNGGVIIAHDAISRENCGDGIIAKERVDSIAGNRIRIEDNFAAPENCLFK